MLVSTLTACGPTITMPNVVGMRLDDAHRALEKLDVDEFEDVDVLGKEDTIFLDRNWVVVSQNPAAGTAKVDTGTKVELSVGNQDDKEVLDRIPSDSPFALEQSEKAAEREKDAAEKEKLAQEEAKQKAKDARAAKKKLRHDAQAYAKKIDRVLGESVPGLVNLYVGNADKVHASGGGPVVAAQNAIAARDAFDRLLSSFNTKEIGPPDSLDSIKQLDGVADRMRDAMAGFAEASRHLITAIDTGAPSAFANELSARERAIQEWNRAMRDIYGAADRKPTLIPAE